MEIQTSGLHSSFIKTFFFPPINSGYRMMKFNIFRTEVCLGDAGCTHCSGQNMIFIFHQLPHTTETKPQTFRCVLQKANLPQLMTAIETGRDKISSLHTILRQHWFPGWDELQVQLLPILNRKKKNKRDQKNTKTSLNKWASSKISLYQETHTETPGE